MFVGLAVIAGALAAGLIMLNRTKIGLGFCVVLFIFMPLFGIMYRRNLYFLDINGVFHTE